jgi:hypothetical protein
MAKIEVWETRDPHGLLDIKHGVWRAELRAARRWDRAAQESVECGQVVKLRASQYADADRAGFSGYVGREFELPVSVLLEVADAIRAGEVPLRGR